MRKITLALIALTSGLASADPGLLLDCRIQREYAEPGTTNLRSEEIRPRLRWSGTEVQVGDDRPVSFMPEQVQDPTAQQFLNLFFDLARQNAPAFLPQSLGQSDRPFEVLIEVPSLQQRFRFQMQATVEE